MANTTGKKFGGRKKGTPNKVSTSVKESLKSVYDRLGGDEAMLEWARENPEEFYRHWIKMLPTEVKQDVTSSDGTLKPISIQVVGVDDNSTD